MDLKDTIAAISTPLGESGIGIVRLSGDKALPIVNTFFKSPKRKELKKAGSYTVSYGFIFNPKTQKKIDEVLVTVMKAPHSYTREDVVEINCHGGIIPLKETLELTLKSGARLAEPGEFTKRAFLNGRLDLAQAEAVADIIRAKTEAASGAALNQLEGRLSTKIREIRTNLLEVLSHLEAAIDFSDEDIETLSAQELLPKIGKTEGKIGELLKKASFGRILREGVKTVLAGRPNVGKSSLLNALLKEDRAIVTAEPGTTRDLIEETLNLKGIPLRIQDTAGLRKPRGEAERLGVEKAKEILLRADLALLIIDGSEPLTPEDLNLLEEAKRAHFKKETKTLIVLNKIDLPLKVSPQDIEIKTNSTRIIKTSATKEWGLQALEEAIVKLVFSGGVNPAEGGALVTNVRHQRALEKASESLGELVKVLRKGFPEEIAATILKEALSHLGEIIGEVTTKDLLDQIFEDFCIGK